MLNAVSICLTRRLQWAIGLLVIGLLVGCGGDSNRASPAIAQTPDNRSVSVAQRWNEVVLESIRKDRVRPPVQARNLFHIAAASYDAWAIYTPPNSTQSLPDTYLLGKNRHNFSCSLPQRPALTDAQPAREEAISYATFQLIKHRYRESPGYAHTLALAEGLMRELGYDPAYDSVDLNPLTPAALGNYIARCYIDYGLQDGSNEAGSHANRYYQPVNQPIAPFLPGNPTIGDVDRWQPITLDVFVDQGGNVISNGAASFVGAEWGNTLPFALQDRDLQRYERAGNPYPVYLDPGQPPSLKDTDPANYQWSFALVAKWSAHLDPADGVTIDISPASLGNAAELPRLFGDHRYFYDEHSGGASEQGYRLNPKTGAPYAPQWVPRGDYTRVLAEFWADGPSSETPPGHWFKIFNGISQDARLAKRFRGQGQSLGSLEWDVKGYFALGGAMHDAAIAAWGVKGWYDYVRPISAIRAMADLGQSSDSTRNNYHPQGIPLDPGFIEIVEFGDLLSGNRNQHVGKIKLRAWRGPTAISDPASDTAGVGWVLAENWFPYQRPSFVSPPFGGYVSGHSTFSRAAAEVLTAFTGDEYFPGGLGEFPVRRNEYLVFEEGPSVDLTLQWATYRDAADQCSLSRIWGGIHPPMDDMPGRLMGEVIGVRAVDVAERFFVGSAD